MYNASIEPVIADRPVLDSTQDLFRVMSTALEGYMRDVPLYVSGRRKSREAFQDTLTFFSLDCRQLTMARDPELSSVYKLEQPEKLRTVLERDKPEDCLPCRVLGAGAFIGLGFYRYYSGKHQLEQQRAKIVRSGSLFGMRARQGGITTIAAVLVGMGFWRLVN